LRWWHIARRFLATTKSAERPASDSLPFYFWLNRARTSLASLDAGDNHKKGIRHMIRRPLLVRRVAALAALSGAVLAGMAQAQEASNQGVQAAQVNELEAIVVTGYTASKKKDIVGAIAVVDLKETEDKPVAGILQALQGEIPGV